MALIRRFIENAQGPQRRHPTTVECGYRIVTVDSDVYLQLDTYGSNDRQIPGKTSQSLQLDREAAQQLKQLLERSFPGV
jgi:hypothetical protein